MSVNGETVSEYENSLRRLASQAFPTFPSDMCESLTVEQFVVLGLRCHELKRYVQFSHPKTVRAISLALEYGPFEGSQDNPWKPRDI